jgi:uncharacterized protein with von Willebrand factor type A (vWA) domain
MSTIRKHKRLAVVSVVLLLFLGAAVGVFWRLRPDPQVRRAKELGQQLMGENGRKLSPEQRRELGREFRNELQQLTPEQRREVFKDRRKAFDERLDKFFKMTRQEQIAQLDADIDRMESMRKQRERARAEEARKPQAAGQTTQGDYRNDAGSNGRGGWRKLSPDEREQRRKQMLDQTTPEQRANMAEYFRQLRERRQQRGLPAFGFGGRGG